MGALDSLADGKILRYSVDLENAQIEMNIDLVDHEKRDILFDGVLAYHLERGEFQNNWLFNIREVSAEVILKEYKSELEMGLPHGWTHLWKKPKVLVKEMAEKQAKAWRIEGSCGLDGFIIAKDVKQK